MGRITAVVASIAAESIFGTHFSGASSFNQSISNGTYQMSLLLVSPSRSATNFDQAISDWDVSSVTDMSSSRFATSFNQVISQWDVSKVTSLYSYTFQAAQQNEPGYFEWDISRVRYMNFMLSDAMSFRQSWCTKEWQLSSYHSFSDGFNLSTGVGLLCCMRGEYMNGSSCALCELGMHQNLDIHPNDLVQGLSKEPFCFHPRCSYMQKVSDWEI